MASIRRYSQADYEVLRDLVLHLHEALRPFDVDLAPGDQIIDRYFHELIAKVDQQQERSSLQKTTIAWWAMCAFGAS